MTRLPESLAPVVADLPCPGSADLRSDSTRGRTLAMAGWAVAGGLLVVLILGLVGSSLPFGWPFGTAGAKGVLVGKVLIAGGPAPPPGTSDVRPMGEDPVSVLSGGREVASTVTAADGSFRFTLPPGTYVLVMPCGEIKVQAGVSAGGTSRKDFTCLAS